MREKYIFTAAEKALPIKKLGREKRGRKNHAFRERCGGANYRAANYSVFVFSRLEWGKKAHIYIRPGVQVPGLISMSLCICAAARALAHGAAYERANSISCGARVRGMRPSPFKPCKTNFGRGQTINRNARAFNCHPLFSLQAFTPASRLGLEFPASLNLEMSAVNATTRRSGAFQVITQAQVLALIFNSTALPPSVKLGILLRCLMDIIGLNLLSRACARELFFKYFLRFFFTR